MLGVRVGDGRGGEGELAGPGVGCVVDGVGEGLEENECEPVGEVGYAEKVGESCYKGAGALHR